jgi:hypothetical protein
VKLDIKYTGTFHVVMKDEKAFALLTKATLKRVTYSKVLILVEDLDVSGGKRSLEGL